MPKKIGRSYFETSGGSRFLHRRMSKKDGESVFSNLIRLEKLRDVQLPWRENDLKSFGGNSEGFQEKNQVTEVSTTNSSCTNSTLQFVCLEDVDGGSVMRDWLRGIARQLGVKF